MSSNYYLNWCEVIFSYYTCSVKLLYAFLCGKYFDNKHFHSSATVSAKEMFRASKTSIRSLCLPINLGMKCDDGPALWPCCLMSEYSPVYYAIMLTETTLLQQMLFNQPLNEENAANS